MVYSREAVLKKFKISHIIGVIGALAMASINVILPIMAGEFTLEAVLLFVGMLIAGVVIFLVELLGFIAMAAGGSGGTTTSTGVPSYLRDVSTNESFYTTKGANGTAYVHRNGTDIPIRETSFSGRYIDDYGNEYI